MLPFLIRRVAAGIWVLCAVMTLVFVLLYQVGDPAAATLGPKAHPEQLQSFRRQYGLDLPLWQQYLGYVGLTSCIRRQSPHFKKGEPCGLLQGNLGESFRQNIPVAQVLFDRLPRTLLLGLIAMIIELLLGVSLGVIAAIKRYTWVDTSIMSLAFLALSVPSFVIGLFVLDFFAFRLGWFPVGGYGLGSMDHIYHALLPALTLALLGAATYVRMMRSDMVEVMDEVYVVAARARGASRWRAWGVHALRNALLPLVTLVGLQLSSLVSGAVITESIFAWPGVGRLAVESIYNLDAPMVMAIVLLASLAVQVGNMLADIAIAMLDPRVRLA